jgi:hypothetical protein
VSLKLNKLNIRYTCGMFGFPRKRLITVKTAPQKFARVSKSSVFGEHFIKGVASAINIAGSIQKDIDPFSGPKRDNANLRKDWKKLGVVLHNSVATVAEDDTFQIGEPVIRRKNAAISIGSVLITPKTAIAFGKAAKIITKR